MEVKSDRGKVWLILSPTFPKCFTLLYVFNFLNLSKILWYQNRYAENSFKWLLQQCFLLSVGIKGLRTAKTPAVFVYSWTRAKIAGIPYFKREQF